MQDEAAVSPDQKYSETLQPLQANKESDRSPADEPPAFRDAAPALFFITLQSVAG